MNVSKHKTKRRYLWTSLGIAVATIGLLLSLTSGPGVIAFAWAQSATATLSGTVLDEHGAVVSGVSVTIASAGTGLRREATSNSDGYFSVSLLPPDRYAVTAQHQGFATLVIKNVVLNVNDQRSLRIELKTGQVSESISIEGAPLVKNESATVSTLVDRQFVENLPLNGRSFNTLIELSPGVVLTKATYADQGQFSVNGQRANANYFVIDGVGANIGIGGGILLNQTGGGTVPAFSVLGGTNNLASVDALQEFSVQTSTYAPEFGRTPGAQVSVVTRSGTNEFSGSLFEYFRNEALDATNWFANSHGLRKPPLRQNDFGGVVGGPIRKHRAFFFFSYEGLRVRQPQISVLPVPTISARQSTAPSVRPLINAFPLPNGPELGDGLAEFTAGFANPSTIDATSIRIDHNVNSKLTLFGRYNHAPSELTERSLANLSKTLFRTDTLTVGATQILTSRTSNDLRGNYSRAKAGGLSSLDDFGGAVPPPDSLLFPSFTSRKDAAFALNFGIVGYSVGGTGDGGNYQRQINLVDNLSVVTGRHQLKFGVDYRRLFPITGGAGYGQFFFFPDVNSLMTGIGGVSISSTDGPLFPLFQNFSAYAQDTWKAIPRLTLSYGLRWEVNTPPTERNGKDALTVIGLDNPATLTPAPPGTPLWKTSYGNFAPRVGVAYLLSEARGHETVVRGGFGIFYDLGTGMAGNAINTFPTAAKNLSNVTFPLTSEQAAPPAFSLTPPFRLFFVSEPDLQLPRTYQWNVAVERSLGVHQTFSASYVAALGRRLMRQEGYSMPNPNFLNVRVTRNTATSDYHSLQLQFMRRLSHGLQSLVSYSWSHSIDISSSDFSFAVPTTRSDPKIDRGSSDFDVRHSLTAAVTYDLPTASERNIARALLRDWSADAIFRARTSTPVTPVFFNRLFGVSSVKRPNLVPGVPIYLDDPAVAGGRRINRGAFVAPPLNQQGVLGRNSLRGFPVNQLDFSLRRQFKIAERYKLQFRADLFNVYNHPNFGDPDYLFESPTFGESVQMLGQSLGTGGIEAGFSPLYQIGGPRSVQLALKVQF